MQPRIMRFVRVYSPPETCSNFSHTKRDSDRVLLYFFYSFNISFNLLLFFSGPRGTEAPCGAATRNRDCKVHRCGGSKHMYVDLLNVLLLVVYPHKSGYISSLIVEK